MFAKVLLLAVAVFGHDMDRRHRHRSTHSRTIEIIEAPRTQGQQFILQPQSQPSTQQFIMQPQPVMMPPPAPVQVDQSQHIASLQYSVNYYYTELQNALATLESVRAELANCQARFATVQVQPFIQPVIAPTPAIVPSPIVIAPTPAPAADNYVVIRRHRHRHRHSRGSRSERIGDAGPTGSNKLSKNSTTLSNNSPNASLNIVPITPLQREFANLN